jgi:hypothetical protein
MPCNLVLIQTSSAGGSFISGSPGSLDGTGSVVVQILSSNHAWSKWRVECVDPTVNYNLTWTYSVFGGCIEGPAPSIVSIPHAFIDKSVSDVCAGDPGSSGSGESGTFMPKANGTFELFVGTIFVPPWVGYSSPYAIRFSNFLLTPGCIDDPSAAYFIDTENPGREALPPGPSTEARRLVTDASDPLDTDSGDELYGEVP